MIDQLRQDLRSAVRQLIRAPVLTLFACVSLAIGIGLASSAFSAFNAAWLKELPVPDPSGLVFVEDDFGGHQIAGGPFSYPDYLEIAQSGVLSAVAATQGRTVMVAATNSAPRREWVEFVTANYFTTLGIQPARGRAFSNAPDAAEIVIDDRSWKHKFDSDPNILGTVLRLNGIAFVIIGVAPEQFHGASGRFNQFGWASIAALPQIEGRADLLHARSAHVAFLTGRLRAGTTREAAAARFDLLSAELAKQHPEQWQRQSGQSREIRLLTYRDNIIGPDDRLQFYGLVGLMSLLFFLVLLLACTNVAGLLLARALARTHEMAVRLTLGASRVRLFSQLITESLLLAFISAAVGCLLAYWAIRITSIEGTLDIFLPDWRVLLAVIAISIAAAVMFGLAPALHCLRTDYRSALAAGAVGRIRMRLRGALIGVQVAMSVLFLLAAGFAIRGIRARSEQNPGFDTQNLVIARPFVDGFEADTAAGRVFITFMDETARSLPSVVGSAAVLHPPFGGSSGGSRYTTATGQPIMVGVNVVSEDYFRVIGLAPIRGRVFASDDRQNAQPVAVVNEAFVREFGTGMLGQLLQESPNSPQVQIIGVVPDVEYSLSRRPQSLLYLSMAQNRSRFSRYLAPSFIVRVAPGSEQTAIDALRSRVQTRYPNVLTPSVQTLEQRIATQLQPQRLTSLIAVSAAAFELLLSAVGLYGLLLYLLLARTREVGVRLALGAQPLQASWAIARDGLRFTANGIIVGLLLGIPGAIIASKVLIGARAGDPVPFIGAGLAVLAATVAAAWIPAVRAARTQPAAALRHD